MQIQNASSMRLSLCVITIALRRPLGPPGNSIWIYTEYLWGENLAAFTLWRVPFWVEDPWVSVSARLRDKTMLTRPGRGLNFCGMLSQVLRPIITAFWAFELCVSLVSCLKWAMSLGSFHGILPTDTSESHVLDPNYLKSWGHVQRDEGEASALYKRTYIDRFWDRISDQMQCN